MIKKIQKIGFVSFLSVALAMGVGVLQAGATTTVAANAITDTGGLTINGAAASALTLGSAAVAGNIVIGGAQTSGTLTIGAATGQTGNVTVYGTITGGVNSLIDNTTTANTTMLAGLTSGTVVIGNATATGAFTIRGSQTTGANGLFTVATTSAINIGTACTTCTITVGGAGANVILMGDNTGATSGTTLIGGSIVLNGAVNYAADAGSDDTYVITLSPVPTAYTTGMFIVFTANTANTTGATINVNSLGAKALVKGNNAALASNDIITGRTYMAVYDGTQFDLLNPTTQ